MEQYFFGAAFAASSLHLPGSPVEPWVITPFSTNRFFECFEMLYSVGRRAVEMRWIRSPMVSFDWES